MRDDRIRPRAHASKHRDGALGGFDGDNPTDVAQQREEHPVITRPLRHGEGKGEALQHRAADDERKTTLPYRFWGPPQQLLLLLLVLLCHAKALDLHRFPCERCCDRGGGQGVKNGKSRHVNGETSTRTLTQTPKFKVQPIICARVRGYACKKYLGGSPSI